MEQPPPYPGDPTPGQPDLCSWSRTYRDALGRPLAGRFTWTGTVRHDTGTHVVPPLPVPVDLDANGLMAVHLPADTYTVAGRLVTPEGPRIDETFTVTLPET